MIEEVKKILKKILRDFLSFTPKYKETIKELNIEPKPDRPDREKIAKKLREIYRYDLDWYPTWAKLTQINKDRWLKKADQILALIPDIEEAKREERERIEPMIELCVSSLKYCERHYKHDNMARLNIEAGWQALKGGNHVSRE